MFRTVPLSIIRSFSLYTQQWYMSYSLRAGSGCPSWSCSQAVSKHVQFYFKNKFEELVYPVGFIITIYHDTRSPERQKSSNLFLLSSMQGMKNVKFLYINCYLKGKIFKHIYGGKMYCRWRTQNTIRRRLGTEIVRKVKTEIQQYQHYIYKFHYKRICLRKSSQPRGTAPVAIPLSRLVGRQADRLDVPGFDLQQQ